MLSSTIIEIAYKMKIFPLLPNPLYFLSYLSLPSLFYLYLVPLTAFYLLSLIHILYTVYYIYIYFFFRSLFFMCFIQLVAHLNNFGNFQFRGMGFDPSYSWATLLTLTIEPPRLLRN